MPPAASRAAFALVVDIGTHMNEVIRDNTTAFFLAKQCLISFIERKIFSESKDEVALILFGSVETENNLNTDSPGFYKNISVKCELGAANWPMAQVAESIQPTFLSADFVEAIVVAADHLRQASDGRRNAFNELTIFVLSNLAGGTDCKDQVGDLIKSFQAAPNRPPIEIRFLGFDSEEEQPSTNGNHPDEPGPSHGNRDQGSQQQPGRKPKDASRLASEAIAQQIIDGTGGDSYTFLNALAILSTMEARKVRPTAWKTPLEVTPTLTIQIQCYCKTKRVSPKSWQMTNIVRTFGSSSAENKETDNGSNNNNNISLNTTTASSSMADTSTVKRFREFRMAEGDSEEKTVEPEGLIKAFLYGSSRVIAAETMLEALKLHNEKSMKVVAFCPADLISSHIFFGDTNMVVLADTAGGDRTATRFSAFVRALAAMKCVAIVRRVYNKACAPRLGCLVPELGDETHLDAFYYVELPFTEEVSMYNFSTLPIGEVAESIPEDKANRDKTQEKQAAHCPDDDQLAAVDALIDAASLPVDDDGELFKVEETRNPHIQHFYRVVRQRILHPDFNDPLPPATEVDNLRLPNQLNDKRKPANEKITNTFHLEDSRFTKYQEPSNNNDDGAPPQQAPSVDIDALMGVRGFATADRQQQPLPPTRSRANHISNETPVQDFVDLVRSASMPFEEITEMLNQVVYFLLGVATGISDEEIFEKCLHCLEQLRNFCLDRRRPGIYNDTLRNLFMRLPSCVQFFASLIQANAGLIVKEECNNHNDSVTAEEAEKFVEEIKAKGGNVSAVRAPPPSAAQKNGAETASSAKTPSKTAATSNARDMLADL